MKRVSSIGLKTTYGSTDPALGPYHASRSPAQFRRTNAFHSRIGWPGGQVLTNGKRTWCVFLVTSHDLHTLIGEGELLHKPKECMSSRPSSSEEYWTKIERACQRPLALLLEQKNRITSHMALTICQTSPSGSAISQMKSVSSAKLWPVLGQLTLLWKDDQFGYKHVSVRHEFYRKPLDLAGHFRQMTKCR